MEFVLRGTFHNLHSVLQKADDRLANSELRVGRTPDDDTGLSLIYYKRIDHPGNTAEPGLVHSRALAVARGEHVLAILPGCGATWVSCHARPVVTPNRMTVPETNYGSSFLFAHPVLVPAPKLIVLLLDLVILFHGASNNAPQSIDLGVSLLE